ncbi:MAG: caspase family protein [Ignavibacteriales bacterium]|nr:caspase family protein [Ignavibacteriales bacterium]
MKVSGGPAVVTSASSLVLRGLAKDSSGIARVFINGEEIPFKPTAQSAEFTSTRLLALGDNEIVIKVADRLGNEGIITLPVRREEEQVGGKNFALLIAIDQYDQWPRLVNPMNDARTVAEELIKSYGFTTEVLDNADRDHILSTLRRYAERKYGENDQLLIFFAGHGQFDEVLGDGYLVAKDSKLKDDIKTSYISHSNLRTVVNSIPCRHIFLVVDACFGGTFDPLIAANLRGEDEYKEVTKTEFIERKLKFKTRRYLTSGGKEYVPDGRPGQHSPFTRRFLEAFRSYGGRDGILTMNEILSFVEKVKPEPRAGEFGGNEPGSDFVFIAR